MQDFGTKADNSPPPGGQLSAAEFNNLATELENAVLRSGQALSGASVVQLATSMFLHAVKSQAFQDSGVANAYVATPVSGSSGVLLPADYSLMAGTTISFRVAATNTVASTLNVGQATGTLLGAKPILGQDGLALPAGALTAGEFAQVQYDPALNSGNGAWVLMPWSSPLANFFGAAALTTTGYFEIPVVVAGVKRTLILQWVEQASVGVGGTVTPYAIAFPTQVLIQWCSVSVNSGPLTQYAACVAPPSLTTIQTVINTGTQAVAALAIGY